MACTGLAISAKIEEWLTLGDEYSNLYTALEELYKQFKDAPILGSLINPQASLKKDDMFELNWEEVGPLLTRALSEKRDDEKSEMGIVAYGLAKSASILVNKYHWILTNVPYLGRGNQNQVLMNYCENYYPEGSRDLAYSFFQRMVELLNNNGIISVVWPQGWLFQPYLKKFRKWMLSNNAVSVIAGLGAGAFETISGEVVNVSLLITVENSGNNGGFYHAIDLTLMAIDSPPQSMKNAVNQLFLTG